MGVSGISNYQNALYKWQGQKLNSTGTGSSSLSKSLGSLFNGADMSSQISSMLELTKYAMDAMGVGQDSRVTFSQITKYRNQLQNEFNEGVKNGFANSGIGDLSSLIFSLSEDGKITVSGGSASDVKKAQAWIDANPVYGETIGKALGKDIFANNSQLQFRISSSGKMTVLDQDTEKMQAFLNANADLSDSLRKGLAELEDSPEFPLDLTFTDGVLTAKGENSAALAQWLENNQEFSEALKKELEKNGVELSSVSLRLGSDGAAQITVHNADLKDAQAALDQALDTGKSMANALSSLGIDPAISFSIQIDENGAIKILSDHPDRDKVQQFFNDNPELVKKYRQIETLAGIDDARKAMQISPSAMRKRIQIESMASWWVQNNDAGSYFGNYSNSNLSLLSGLNISV